MGILWHQFRRPFVVTWAFHACEARCCTSVSRFVRGLEVLLFLTSGITSAVGEQCLVKGASMEPCLEAIAAGDGREIMQFDEDPSRSPCARFLV